MRAGPVAAESVTFTRCRSGARRPARPLRAETWLGDAGASRRRVLQVCRGDNMQNWRTTSCVHVPRHLHARNNLFTGRDAAQVRSLSHCSDRLGCVGSSDQQLRAIKRIPKKYAVHRIHMLDMVFRAVTSVAVESDDRFSRDER